MKYLLLAMGFIQISLFAKADFYLDGGAYVTQLSQRLNAASGLAGEMSTLSGFLRGRPVLSIGKNYYWEPSLGFMFPWRKGNDGSTKTLISHLAFDFSKKWSWFKLRVGPGIFWQYIMSDAESVVLDNGTSTSTFYTPERNVSIYLIILQGGITFQLSQKMDLNADIYTLQPLSGSRRRFNASLTLGFKL